MKRLGIVWVAATAVILFASSAWAGEVLNRVMTTKIMKVATSPAWPPQSFINDKNEMDGFDVDVAHEIARRLGVKAEFVTPEWSVITSGRWNGRWDVSVGSITPTKKRAEVLSFPAVYYYTLVNFAVHKDSKITGKADLNGKRIGVTGASTYEQYLNKTLVIDALGTPEFSFDVTAGKIVSYGSDTISLDDLRLGDGVRLDAALSSNQTLKTAIKNGYPIKILPELAYAEPLAVATDKGDTDFDRKLAAIVKAMRADGTMTRLSDKWFGADYSTVR